MFFPKPFWKKLQFYEENFNNKSNFNKRETTGEVLVRLTLCIQVWNCYHMKTNIKNHSISFHMTDTLDIKCFLLSGLSKFTGVTFIKAVLQSTCNWNTIQTQFRSLQSIKNWAFCEVSQRLKAIDYFLKKLHLRCCEYTSAFIIVHCNIRYVKPDLNLFDEGET